MKAITLYIGLDVHNDSITLAIAEPGRQGEILLLGIITHDLHTLEKALARLRKAHPGARLEAGYEAGPCGFGLARRLQQLETPCLLATITQSRNSRCSRRKVERLGRGWCGTQTGPHFQTRRHRSAYLTNVFREPTPGKTDERKRRF